MLSDCLSNAERESRETLRQLLEIIAGLIVRGVRGECSQDDEVQALESARNSMILDS